MVDEERPLISVIMACYNAASYIEEAISSVLQQTNANTEVIVVDDGSTDDSTVIVNRLASDHPGQVYLKHQGHSGPYPARNLGLHEARGDFVAFLDADDWWREDCLEKLMQALQDSQADLAYCGWQNVGDHSLSPEPHIPPAYEDDDTVAAFLAGCPWPIHAALVPTSCTGSGGRFLRAAFFLNGLRSVAAYTGAYRKYYQGT